MVQPSAIAVKRQVPWFDSKDRGSYDAAGYFYHEGRSDEVIISAGWTMGAVEIEHTLLTHVWSSKPLSLACRASYGSQRSGGWRALRKEREWLGGY